MAKYTHRCICGHVAIFINDTSAPCPRAACGGQLHAANDDNTWTPLEALSLVRHFAAIGIEKLHWHQVLTPLERVIDLVLPVEASSALSEATIRDKIEYVIRNKLLDRNFSGRGLSEKQYRSLLSAIDLYNNDPELKSMSQNTVVQAAINRCCE